ncbi:hypothetical protein H4582DRAFT_2054565 [Lactarius indigo]|nr:hypothetical protein H4582DRAFT_2054565 [Lactarius indigo]
MSQIPSSSTSSTNFEAIFTAALEAYKKQTKNDITAHPLAAQLKSCDSPGAVLDLLQAQVQAFDKSQSGNKRLTNWLDPTVNVLFAFSTTLGNAVGLVYPPSNAIFAGIGVLLQAVKDVRASQDALIDLFGRMDNFFKRLEKHIEVRPTAAMTDIIVKIMVEVLSILGIVTKEIGQGTMKKYLKKLVGRKDVEDALQRLDKLTQAEAFMAAAETLAIARGIDAKVEDVDGKVQGVDERVQSVDTKVEGINDKVQDVDSKVQDVDSRVQGVDTKVQSVDGKVQGIDTKVEGVDNKVQGVDSRVRTVDSNVQGVDHKIGSVIQGVKETGIAIQQVVDQVSDLNSS